MSDLKSIVEYGHSGVSTKTQGVEEVLYSNESRLDKWRSLAIIIANKKKLNERHICRFKEGIVKAAKGIQKVPRKAKPRRNRRAGWWIQ